MTIPGPDPGQVPDPNYPQALGYPPPQYGAQPGYPPRLSAAGAGHQQVRHLVAGRLTPRIAVRRRGIDHRHRPRRDRDQTAEPDNTGWPRTRDRRYRDRHHHVGHHPALDDRATAQLTTAVRQDGGWNDSPLRSIPAARPLPAITNAILRLASSIISSPSITAVSYTHLTLPTNREV